MATFYSSAHLNPEPPVPAKPDPGLLTFGQLLKVKRESMGLSQTEVARRLKNMSTYQFYEKDAYKPTAKNLELIKDFYSISDRDIAECKPTISKTPGPVGRPKVTIGDVVAPLSFKEVAQAKPTPRPAIDANWSQAPTPPAAAPVSVPASNDIELSLGKGVRVIVSPQLSSTTIIKIIDFLKDL